MDIKEQLQRFFDKDILSIFKKGNLYYVVLDDGLFVKPVYEIDINGVNIVECNIPSPVLDKEYEFIWSKNNQGG